MYKTLLHSHALLLVFLACLVLVQPAYTTPAGKNTDLEKVRDQIEDVKSILDNARGESEKLQDELRKTETIAGQEAIKLREVEQLIQSKQTKLDDMNSVIAMHTQKLERERQLLGGQIKIAYITGRNDYLKLLLNQEDPARVGRMLAYYDYFNRARAANIRSVLDKVETIRQFQQNIQSETDLLMELKSRRIANSEELATWRESRQTILARLQNDISAKDQQLKSLKEHEKKLSTLLRQLDDNKNLISTYQDSSPFGSLSGKLQWPVSGRLLNAFGDERRGPSLTWDGIRIAAAAGHEVHAVYNGKVVFSGWFRNLGLLLIIDHGDGYMSLYGHNQSLQKKSGDMVATGEVIAYVGDSGGQDVPAVYFEIRQNGKPRDPSFWCSR